MAFGRMTERGLASSDLGVGWIHYSSKCHESVSSLFLGRSSAQTQEPERPGVEQIRNARKAFPCDWEGDREPKAGILFDKILHQLVSGLCQYL